MKWTIECWKDHHLGWTEKTIKNLNDLMNLFLDGFLWWREDDKHDQRVIITIEEEE
jgi:hypothetical protein